MFAAFDQSLIFALVLAAFFIADMALLIFVLTRQGSKPQAESKPENEPEKPMRWWAWPTLGLFFLVWAGMTGYFDFITVRSAVRHYRSYSFDAVEGTVLSSSMVERDSGDETTYDVDIEYSYRVGAQEFRGKRVRYYKLWDKIWVKEFVRQHPRHSPVTVYYDPANPAEAVLLREVDGGLLWMAMFLVPFNMAMVGLLALPIIVLRKDDNSSSPFTVIESESKSRIDLGPITPWSFALIVFFLFTFLTAFCLAFCCTMPPSLPATTIAWTIVLCGTVYMYVQLAVRKRAGNFALFIDTAERTIKLPQVAVGVARVVVRFSDLVAVEVVAVTDREGATTYEPMLRWRTAEGVLRENSVTAYSDKKSADALAALIQTKVGLGPS